MCANRKLLLYLWIAISISYPFTMIADDTSSAIQRRAETELLALHQADRHAHLQHDVNALISHLGTTLIDVHDGKIQRITRDDVRKRFVEYFRTSQFVAWDDVEPPIVRASPDGRSGWMIVRVHIVYNETSASGQSRNDSVLAWMSTYEKKNGVWILETVTTTTQTN